MKGGLRVIHLLFIDDCVIFIRATNDEWRSIYSIHEFYEKASGQKLTIIRDPFSLVQILKRV